MLKTPPPKMYVTQIRERDSFKNLILFLYEKVINTWIVQIIILTKISIKNIILGKKMVNAENPPKTAPIIKR